MRILRRPGMQDLQRKRVDRLGGPLLWVPTTRPVRALRVYSPSRSDSRGSSAEALHNAPVFLQEEIVRENMPVGWGPAVAVRRAKISLDALTWWRAMYM